jgi:hypothetical protein
MDAAYADAHAAFGDRGLVEMTVLIGCQQNLLGATG